MRTFTCAACGREWPGNYCPECAKTIERTLTSGPVTARVTELRPTVCASGDTLPTRNVFWRAFLISVALQLLFYVLYMVGWKYFHSFANAYVWFYFPGVWCTSAMLAGVGEDSLGVGLGGVFLGPLLGILLYSLVLALTFKLWFTVGRSNALYAA